MVCGGVPNLSPNHSEKVLDTSIAMLMESKFVLSPITRQPIKIRVGVHSGSVVAGKLIKNYMQAIVIFRCCRNKNAKVRSTTIYSTISYDIYT
jgi:hypothetical protein